MKAIWIGLALMVVISAVGWGATNLLDTTSGESFLSENRSVRLN